MYYIQTNLNGELVGSGSDNIVSSVVDGNGNFQIGANMMGSFKVENGVCFDDVRFYSGIHLTQEQVIELYNGRVEILQTNGSKIVLYQDTINASLSYAFGINTSILSYTVPLNCSYVFYIDGTETFNINSSTIKFEPVISSVKPPLKEEPPLPPCETVPLEPLLR